MGYDQESFKLVLWCLSGSLPYGRFHISFAQELITLPLYMRQTRVTVTELSSRQLPSNSCGNYSQITHRLLELAYQLILSSRQNSDNCTLRQRYLHVKVPHDVYFKYAMIPLHMIVNPSRYFISSSCY